MEVVDIVIEINKMLTELQSSQDTLSSKLSWYDNQEQDLLHYIENSKLNAVQMSKFCKKLKEVRNARRKIKEDLGFLASISTKVPRGLITLPKLPDTYEVRTQVLEDFDYERGGKMKVDKENPVVIKEMPAPVDMNVNMDDFSVDGKYIVSTNPLNGNVTRFKTFTSAVVHALTFTPTAKTQQKRELNKEVVHNIIGLNNILKNGGGAYLGYTWSFEDTKDQNKE